MTTIATKYDDVCACADEMAIYVAEVCCSALLPAEVMAVESDDGEYRLSVQEEGDTVYVFIRRKGQVPIVWRDEASGVRLYLCPLLVQLHDKVLSMRLVRDASPPADLQEVIGDVRTVRALLEAADRKLDTLLEGTK